MKDARERFSAVASAYGLFRPSYPSGLIDWILARTRLGPGAKAADIGCGTGISTRLLAARGLEVVGVDPNEAMLAQARSAGGAAYRQGEAAATGLPGRCVDLVAAAQAFHWFDLEPAMKEFSRILKPGGWCAAFWNLRGDTPFLKEYKGLLRRHCSEYESLPKFPGTLEAIKRFPRTISLQRAEFPNAQRLDRAGFFGRVYSSSYVAVGLRDQSGFDKALNDLFDKHQEEGLVEFAYAAVALVWRLREE